MPDGDGPYTPYGPYVTALETEVAELARGLTMRGIHVLGANDDGSPVTSALAEIDRLRDEATAQVALTTKLAEKVQALTAGVMQAREIAQGYSSNEAGAAMVAEYLRLVLKGDGNGAHEQ